MGSFLFDRTYSKNLSGKERNMEKKMKKGRLKKLTGLLFLLLFVFAFQVQAEEAEGETDTEEVVENRKETFVYHEHIGTEAEPGGCYTVPIYHAHEGSRESGGACYEIPIYHCHEGDEAQGGACYQTAVCHIHEGEEGMEGGCYQAVYHSHSGGCYSWEDAGGCAVLKVEDTDEGDYGSHDYKYFYVACGEVVHGTNSAHKHNVLSCSRSTSVPEYLPGCGKTTETVEYYVQDCGKTEEDIDAYELSCTKTEQDIDGYAPGCGRTEEIPIGKIILTWEESEDKKKVSVMAQFEDLSEGEVVLSENPFCWQDGAGNEIGWGEMIEVTKNGNYQVTVSVENDDVNKDSLRSGMEVDSIPKPAPVKEDNGEDDDEDTGEREEGNEEEEETPLPVQTKVPSPSPTPTPLVVANVTQGNTKSNTVGATTKEKNTKQVVSAVKRTTEHMKQSPSPTVTPSWEIEQETVMAEQKESNTKEQVAVLEVPKEIKQKSFFASPAGKVISVTFATLLIAGGLFLLFFLLRWSVRLYNDDGEGNLIYLGRCMIRVEEEGYITTISEKQTERSVTNRYCLKSEVFHLMKRQEEELLVERGQKRVAVLIAKEMIVVI